MTRKRILWLIVLSAAAWTVSPAAEQVVRYPSVDQFGKPIELSGRLTTPPDSAKGIILLLHGTYTSNDEIPSNKPMYEEKWFAQDYVLVMPDYMGYGATKDSIHPYLCGELTAQQNIDMLLFVRTILDTLPLQLLTDSITIVGYSQGAATALWSFKLLEERYAEQLPVKACLAGDGPYDLAAEFDACVQKNRTGMPVTIPMMILGMDMGYQLHLNTKDFFTRATERMTKRYVIKKEHGYVDVWFKTPVHLLSHWLTKKGRDKNQPSTQRIYDGLMRSSLIHYPIDNHPVGQDTVCPIWRPKAMTLIFHSTNDEIVGFHNAEHLRRCWGTMENVQYEFGKFGAHLVAYKRFMQNVVLIVDN